MFPVAERFRADFLPVAGHERPSKVMLLGLVVTMFSLVPVEILLLLVLISVLGALLVIAGVSFIREVRGPKSHGLDPD